MNMPQRLPALWSREALTTIGALFLAVLMGIAAASGKLMIVALLGGALSALALAAKPSLVFWSATFVTLAVAGIVKFFVPALDRIWWLAYGMVFLLYLPAILQLLQRKPQDRVGGSGMIGLCLAIFVLDLIAASVIAASPVEQLLVAAKSLLMFGGLWAYFAVGNIEAATVWKWLKCLLGIALFQWLPALFQFIFVRGARQAASSEHAVSAADSVVGTFGGGMESGGLTAVLAFFLVAAIIMLITMRGEKILSRRRALFYGALIVFPLLLMEVKIIFFYLPIALVVLFRAEIVRRPHVFVGWACVGAVALLLLLLSYQMLHWSVRGGNWQDGLVRAFSYSFEEKADRDAADSGIMTRRQTLEFWAKTHGMSNIHQTLIGHGMGASRARGLALGEMAKRHAPLLIDRSGFSLLLWDVGIIGTLAVLGALFGMYSQGGRLARSALLLPWQRALARGLQALAPLYLLSLLYRNDIPYAAPMMFLFMGSFGLIAWLNREYATARRRQKR